MIFNLQKTGRHLLFLVPISLFFGITNFTPQVFSKSYDQVVHPREIILSHYVHAVREEIDCTDCHEGAQEEAKASMPSHTVCVDCHEEIEKKEDKKGCLLCHNITLQDLAELEKGETKVKMGSDKDRKLEFSHKIHIEKEYQCSDCHGDIKNQKLGTFNAEGYIPKPESCINCHNKTIQGFEVTKWCTKCHLQGTYDRAKKPEYHKVNWKKYHGAASPIGLNETEAHGLSCFTCHNKYACIDCHNTEKPKDHTNFWRTRGHGLIASGDRERCVTCHKQDFCISCHNETSPRSHKLNWGKNHCPKCHLDSGDNFTGNCKLCHKTPSHLGIEIK